MTQNNGESSLKIPPFNELYANYFSFSPTHDPNIEQPIPLRRVGLDNIVGAIGVFLAEDGQLTSEMSSRLPDQAITVSESLLQAHSAFIAPVQANGLDDIMKDFKERYALGCFQPRIASGHLLLGGLITIQSEYEPSAYSSGLFTSDSLISDMMSQGGNAVREYRWNRSGYRAGWSDDYKEFLRKLASEKKGLPIDDPQELRQAISRVVGVMLSEKLPSNDDLRSELGLGKPADVIPISSSIDIGVAAA